MKKFLVLFLLVSLVPFTVGCRLFDKGDDATVVPTLSVSASALLPASMIPGPLGSIRAQVTGALSDLTMELDDVVLTAFGTPTAVGARFRVAFRNLNVPVNKFNNITQNNVKLKIKVAGDVRVETQLNEALGTVDETFEVDVIENPATNLPEIAGVKKGTQSVTNEPNDTVATDVYVKAEKIEIVHGETAKTMGATTVEIDTTNPSFKVTFPRDVTGIEDAAWIMTVQRTGPTAAAAFDISNTDDLMTVTVETVDDKSVVTITPKQSSQYSLSDGKTYKVTVKSAEIAGTTKTVLTPEARSFKVVLPTQTFTPVNTTPDEVR